MHGIFWGSHTGYTDGSSGGVSQALEENRSHFILPGIATQGAQNYHAGLVAREHRAQLTAVEIVQSTAAEPGARLAIERPAVIVFAGVLERKICTQLKFKHSFAVGIGFTACQSVADTLNGNRFG